MATLDCLPPFPFPSLFLSFPSPPHHSASSRPFKSSVSAVGTVNPWECCKLPPAASGAEFGASLKTWHSATILMIFPKINWPKGSLGGRTAISGGGTRDTGCGTPFQLNFITDQEWFYNLSNAMHRIRQTMDSSIHQQLPLAPYSPDMFLRIPGISWPKLGEKILYCNGNISKKFLVQ